MLTKKYNGGFMKGERQNDISELLAFAGSRKVLTFIGLILSGISMLFSMVPYICIWLTARSLIEAAPHWREAVDITRYGWTAFIFAFGGIAIPRFSSPKSTNVSPGLILNNSLACFGITICPFSPTVAVQAYFPFGFVKIITPSQKYDLYNKLYYDFFSVSIYLLKYRYNFFSENS